LRASDRHKGNQRGEAKERHRRDTDSDAGRLPMLASTG
jgi:hypothetical protein